MKTEKELKDKCTPEFIKWMGSLTDYFHFSSNNDCEQIIGDEQAFPLLIHRAVEGWNKGNEEYQIRIDGDEIYIPTFEFGESSCKHFKKASDYQPQLLTQLECAMLDCLLDIFTEEKK